MTANEVRRLTAAEIDAALQLAWKTYLEFEAPDYGPEGVERFRHDIVDNDAFRHACINGEHRLWGAFDGKRLIGFAAMRGKSHICLFFVHKDYHRRGVATAIWRELLRDVLRADPKLNCLTLNSSPYALPFYFHLGWEATGEEKTLNGIRFTPLMYRIAPPQVISLRKKPEQLDRFLDFFVRHWHNEAVYRDCLTACLHSDSPLPQWYLLTNQADDIIGGAGLIPNDFISRMDLTPWLCALFVEEFYRGNAFGRRLIEHVKTETARLGYERLYLCTGHVGYYEQYGFEYIGDGFHPWGGSSRIYRTALKSRSDTELELVVPGKEYETDVLDYKAEHFAWGETRLHGAALLDEIGSYTEWLKLVLGNIRPETVHPGWVTADTLLAIRKSDRKLIGMVDIRHELNEFLRNYGGHIGYGVRPTERRRGYATQILNLALEHAWRLGLSRVMVTCNKDNEASRKTIVKCGGRLEREFIHSDGETVQVFWIDANSGKPEKGEVLNSTE